MAKPSRFDQTFENSQPLVVIGGRDCSRCHSHDLKRRLTSAAPAPRATGHPLNMRDLPVVCAAILTTVNAYAELGGGLQIIAPDVIRGVQGATVRASAIVGPGRHWLAGQRRSELLINGSWMLDRRDGVHLTDGGRYLVESRQRSVRIV